IHKLYKAADRRSYDEVAALLERLLSHTLTSGEAFRVHVVMSTTSSLGGRAAEARTLIELLPPPEALCDPAQRDGACEAITRLCRFGGRLVEGRRRPTGKRSRPTFRPLLYAPEPRRNFPKRDPERDFVMWLSIAWREVTGSAPSRTARHRGA